MNSNNKKTKKKKKKKNFDNTEEDYEIDMDSDYIVYESYTKEENVLK